MPVTDCGSAGDPAANTILGASTCAPKPAWITAKWCEQGCTSTSMEGETNWCQQPVLESLSGFFLCFCLENIPKEREGGSCQRGLLCQHLNRISSGCSHLIPAVPHFWSLFQSFYLSLKAFNCFLSVPGLDSAQVPGWRYPLGHGIVARAAVAGTPSRAAQSCASAAVRGLCGQIQTKGLGDRKENTSDGRLCSPPGCLFTRQNYFSICLLGRGRERCGKSLLEHEYLLQLVLQGFWTTCLPFFTTRHAWDMEKASQKTCSEWLSSYKWSCSELFWEEGGIFKQKLWKTALWMMKVIPSPSGRAFHLPFGPFGLFHCWIRVTKVSDS